MFSDSQLDELHSLLNAANVTDDYIARGVRLTTDGTAKVAKRFGIEADQVPNMLISLSKKLAGDLDEDAPRFTHERDYMGNITIRDNKTGKSHFVQGDSAFALEDELAANPDKAEEIIARLFNVEVLSESEVATPEIMTDKGTFNFPYKGMFATAVFGLDADGKFQCEVVSLRDYQNEEVEITASMQSDLDSIAMGWVDKV